MTRAEPIAAAELMTSAELMTMAEQWAAAELMTTAEQMMAARLLPVRCGEHDEDPADWPLSRYSPPSAAPGTGRPAPLADQRPETLPLA
jgi:hypothetical protein